MYNSLIIDRSYIIYDLILHTERGRYGWRFSVRFIADRRGRGGSFRQSTVYCWSKSATRFKRFIRLTERVESNRLQSGKFVWDPIKYAKLAFYKWATQQTIVWGKQHGVVATSTQNPGLSETVVSLTKDSVNRARSYRGVDTESRSHNERCFERQSAFVLALDSHVLSLSTCRGQNGGKHHKSKKKYVRRHFQPAV